MARRSCTYLFYKQKEGIYIEFFILIITITTGLIVITCSILAFVYRSHIPHITGMMAAMGVGMSVGLTIGVLLGVVLQGNLLTSTILAMAVGVLTGVLIGASLGTLAVLDGGLAGLMGGMMGAMLGEMLPLEDAAVLIKILLAVSLCIALVFIHMFQAHKQYVEHISLKWLLRPLVTFCLILLIFISIDQITVSSDPPHMEHMKHSSHHNLSLSDSPIPRKTISVVTTNLHYYPNQITVNRSETVELQLINNDDIEHDLEFLRIPHKEEELNSGSLIHIHAQPRTTSTLTFTPIMEGSYEFYCTIPGHKEGGMVGILIVK
jgi:plastocyanin